MEGGVGGGGGGRGGASKQGTVMAFKAVLHDYLVSLFRYASPKKFNNNPGTAIRIDNSFQQDRS